MQFSLDKRTGRAVLLLLLAVGLVALYLLITQTSAIRSVELGIATHSPSGMFGGAVVPASCPSYAHSPGECGGGGGGGGGETTPTDVCTNITGVQATVPAGYTANGTSCRANNCEENPYQTSCDRCVNINGFQEAVPAGYTLQNNQCIERESCSLNASSIELQFGQSTTLSWSCSQSASASGSNFATGGASSGSVEVTPEDTTTYLLQCQAGCNDEVRVAVADPTLAISANPLRVRSGNSAMLFWGATQATNCSVTGPNFSATGITGSRSTGIITGQSTYTLSCDTSKGRRSASVTITLIPSQVEI